jgi:hypothetical protein
MRCHVAARASAISTAARGPSLYAIANRPFYVVEVGITNVTDTEFPAALQRATAAGTQGAALTEVCEDSEYTTIATTAFNTHTADATISAGEFARDDIAAAKGAGAVWTFGKNGLRVPAGTANGLVITCPTGLTGQLFDYYWIWDE